MPASSSGPSAASSEQRLTVAGVLILFSMGGRRGALGGKVKSKKPKWPASLRWENIVIAIIFLGILWFVTHISMPPG
jgi:hypothetical protein